MHRSAFSVLLAVVSCFCLQQQFADAGIIKGFKKEVPSPEALLSAFDDATRQLREKYASMEDVDEAGRITHRTVEEVVEATDTTTDSGPRGAETDAAPGMGGTEVSFMIVSF
jgi:hypothetical protein